MTLILDFGHFALAGGFLKPEMFPAEKKYPLQLYFCEECCLLQITHKVPRDILFRDYFYFSSAIETLRKHFCEYAEEVWSRFLNKSEAVVVEIGCNDGILLRPLSKLGVKTVIGVDPASNVVKTINDPAIFIVNDYFSENISEEIINRFGHADLIAANNVYAHLENVLDVTKGIHKLLSKDGVFVFEVHYLKNLIEEFQYDMIYHEHLFYYSLVALNRFFRSFNMEIFDAKKIPIHAGSIRCYVRKKESSKNNVISESLQRLNEEEIEGKYDVSGTFLAYAQRLEAKKTTLMNYLHHLKKEGNSIHGYGASGRANTIIQYCGISGQILDGIIDDAPAKQGYYTPGSHIRIEPRTVLEQKRPGYILIFAWSFVDEIISRNHDYLAAGGKFIIPLPEVKVLSLKDGRMIEDLI